MTNTLAYLVTVVILSVKKFHIAGITGTLYYSTLTVVVKLTKVKLTNTLAYLVTVVIMGVKSFVM
jgi:hypothetical protein